MSIKVSEGVILNGWICYGIWIITGCYYNSYFHKKSYSVEFYFYSSSYSNNWSKRSNFLIIETNRKNLFEVNCFSWSMKESSSSVISMIFAFKVISLPFDFWKNKVILSLRTSFQSCEWSRWLSIMHLLQMRLWCLRQNLETTYSVCESQKISGICKFSSINFLNCLLGPSLTGLTHSSGAQWSEWQKEQSNCPLITMSLLWLLIMSVCTQSRQAVSSQHFKFIGSLVLRL